MLGCDAPSLATSDSCLALPLVSPSDSEPGSPWAVDTLAEEELGMWSGGGESDPLCDPPECRTLFDSKGFIFNTTGQGLCCGSPLLQVPRPRTLPLSPSRTQLLSLVNPQSPGHDHLTAVLRPPPPPTLYPSLALLRAVELDAGAAERALASPRGRFLSAATRLHGRLLDLDSENGALLLQGCLLRLSFEEILMDTNYLLRQSRQLQKDLRDVLYLNDLLWMLRGRLERVSRRRWPFLAAHVDVYGETNLVV